MIDVFPTTVHTPDGQTHSMARVVVTDDDRALLFQEVDGEPRFRFEAAVVIPPDSRRHLNSLDTADGTWTFSHAGGCGCRSVLRRTTAARLLELATTGG